MLLPGSARLFGFLYSSRLEQGELLFVGGFILWIIILYRNDGDMWIKQCYRLQDYFCNYYAPGKVIY